MSYEYEHAVPFEYKRYKLNKHIEFTDEIKVQLDNFYKYIDKLTTDNYSDNKGKLDTKKLTTDLSQMYAQIREEYIKPLVIKYYKYKNIAYTQNEVDFIFQCSYRLIEKFGLSQNNLSKIFGMKPNKFAKLGCFPKRSYDAYTKLNDVYARKSLIPNDTNSEGIRIAECINKTVQAVYNCSAFIGITNMLDVFANISATDTKAYVITRPVSVSANNNIDNIFAYPRFLFATANNLENNINDKSYVAGAIKRQIISFLKMQDNSVLKFSQICSDLLIDGNIDKSFIATSNIKSFNRDLEIYRNQIILLDDIEDGSYSSEYFEDDSILDEFGLEEVEEDEVNIYDEEELAEYLDGSIKRLKEKLTSNMSFANRKFEVSEFQDYKLAMFIMLQEKYKLYSDYSSGVCKSLNEDDKIKLASIFWIYEVLGLNNTSEVERDNVLKSLRTKSLLGYVDSLNKEIKKGGETHIFYESNDFNVKDILVKKQTIDMTYPVLLYIDADSYQLSNGNIVSLMQENNIIIVVKDRSDLASKIGFKVLDSTLNLYMLEVNDGNNKEV